MKKKLKEKLLNINKSLVSTDLGSLDSEDLQTNINAVEVQWLDAFARHAKKTEEHLKKHVKPVHCFRMGYILKEDDEILLVASEISVYPKDEIYFRGTIAIPKVNVIKIVRLEENK